MELNEDEPEGQSEAARLLAGLIAEWTQSEASGLPGLLRLGKVELIPALFQPREMSEKHISDLRRVIKGSGETDPVTVLQVGKRVILIDGHHRHEAYKREQRGSIPVVWFSGTPREAALEAGTMNSKAKLPMTSAERQDYAWRLVLIGVHSKAEVAMASGVSGSQVATMRKVKKDLGEAAADQRTWWQARKAAQGGTKEMGEEAREQWKQELADRWADRMASSFSTKMALNPEVAAMALSTYFGGKLGEVVKELREHVSADEWDDDGGEF